MPVFKQLSVFLENKPGALARLCESFTEQKINIIAMCVSDTVDHAVIRLIVSDPAKALLILEQYGVLVVENEVLGLRMADKPGVLMQIANKLGKIKVNIEYGYGTAGSGKNSLMILRVSNTEKARKALKA